MKKVMSGMFFATLLVLNGCSPSVENSISKCESKASEATVGLVASNQFQKAEIEDKEQGVFYRCMKDSGFVENETVTNEYRALVDGAYPTFTAEEKLGKVNAIRRQNMHIPERNFWKRR